MRKTAVIQIVIALVLSLIAGVLVFKWMNARLGAKQQEDASSQVTIIVAAKDIAKGEKLTEELLKQARFLKENAPSGTYAEVESLTNRVAAFPIGEGEAITASRLVSDEAFSGVSTLIAPGKRAVAVKGNKVLGLSGFIRPGNHVDVLVTMDIQDKNKDEYSFSKTVLEDIKVIATGTELEPEGDDGETSSMDTYTLELSSEESEKLALAASRGTLHFALRNPADVKDVRTEGIDVPKLMSSLKQPKGKSGKPKYVGVEVITGTSRKTVRFARHD
ncbi:Flp pilus assembly protein CpaB [Desulfovibrio ferrophilus]|uniref:Flp pilus assembly protein CpaB n=1 Tax=Desulfovibrio ferrophilus TaxID=241368 RepID=A0A2Z6AY62_9BACT|nr:Flp pilus assembly protein CpaB [Desulfovibrio ferrophilus]BBD08120.1 Flp pilus assembly protein CpaB [Desulfovibrio ferrophilus]